MRNKKHGAYLPAAAKSVAQSSSYAFAGAKNKELPLKRGLESEREREQHAPLMLRKKNPLFAPSSFLIRETNSLPLCVRIKERTEEKR